MKIIFAGTPEFAASALAAIHAEHDVVAVLTQPDRPAGRGMKVISSAVKQLALELGLNILQPATLKSLESQTAIADLDADVMVVAAYGLILPKAVLQIPAYGCLNIHASLLPRWRGAAPIQRAIQAGDAETGITIMQMDEGLDTGDMLLKRVCPIAMEDTAQTLHDKLSSIGASSIMEALQMLAEGRLEPVRQNNDDASYAAKLLKNEAQINWQLDAHQLARTIRAFNPFPVCQSELNGVTIKVWQASLRSGLRGSPGEIIDTDKLGITVACGADALCLEIIQRPGGKPQPAQQLLQALPARVGDRFATS
jgi:methionyl-tRNA formyltransferase